MICGETTYVYRKNKDFLALWWSLFHNSHFTPCHVILVLHFFIKSGKILQQFASRRNKWWNHWGVMESILYVHRQNVFPFNYRQCITASTYWFDWSIVIPKFISPHIPESPIIADADTPPLSLHNLTLHQNTYLPKPVQEYQVSSKYTKT